MLRDKISNLLEQRVAIRQEEIKIVMKLQNDSIQELYDLKAIITDATIRSKEMN